MTEGAIKMRYPLFAQPSYLLDDWKMMFSQVYSAWQCAGRYVM